MLQYIYKYCWCILIAMIGLYKPIIAQSVVLNKNYNYIGNIFTASNGNKFYNNETFRSCIEKNGRYACFGYSTNQRNLFPSSISNLAFNGIIFEIDNQSESLSFFHDEYYSEIGKGNWYNEDILFIGGGTTTQIPPYNTFKIFGINSVIIDTFDTGLTSNSRGILFSDFYNNIFHISSSIYAEDSVSISIRIYNESLQNSNISFINAFYYNQALEVSIKDSFLYISGVHYDEITSRRKLFLLKYNIEQQDLVWKNSYGRANLNLNVPENSTHTFQSGNFFLAGSVPISGGGPFPSVQGGLLIKTDAEGNELWQKTYNRGNPDYSEFFKGIKAHPDGTLIIAGETRDYSYTPTPSAPRGWLIKMDTEGNIIWERTISRYHEYDWDDYVNDVLLTTDGGIALAGYVIHNDIQDALGIYHRNDAWLVKTDSCGFTTGDEPEPLILVQSSQELTIQLQNATQNYCTATLTWGDGTEEQIYAYSQPIYGYNPNLTHTYTQPGTYQVCIEALAGEEFRSYCTEVIIEPNSINSLPQGGGLGEGVKIFPNPTNNYFILETPLPFGEGQGVGFVFSPTGQLIHQFEIKPQLQQKIDISNLPEGVYIIKIENNQFSTSKKLVVVR